MTSYAQKLLGLKPDAHDVDVAVMIAEALLESDIKPYTFSINHNVGAPKYEACPLDYHWTLKKEVGIAMQSRVHARLWIIAALMKGYTVTQAHPKARVASSNSIARARSRAAYHQQPKDHEDDIPF